MSAERVLRALGAGTELSGAALAQHLSVTRAAIWKQVMRLRALGVPVEAVAGRGYRLARPVELLDAARIEAGLGAGARSCARGVTVAFELDSTNSELLRRPPGTAHGEVCLAEYQHGGRGRRGRRWHSPLAANLYGSVGWRFESGAAALGGLSLAVGVAALRALERCGVTGVELKWPNDLVAGGDKLGGVLIELGGEITGPCDAVIGVGINVAMPPCTADAIDQPWTDVATLAPGTTREALAIALFDELLPALSRYERDGFAPFRAAFERADALRGREIRLDPGRGVLAGTALGVDEHGLLRVLVDGIEQRFASGEASLRVR
ncbi:MAG TPA: biotin--[acetyl-CoA-carboxylase] ligase [Candidatus Saccharimonadia bacterium]|nr:biotin--[acetyl-CoA-carboxylase] ligase [Candidatus Saccharimonadia bacterium]